VAQQWAQCTRLQVFPYPLDAFQRKALEKFLDGKSVVVCAPTGAGKTAIAEAAAAAVLARGQRVIYTTPLKVPGRACNGQPNYKQILSHPAIVLMQLHTPVP
jgi:superfamily II DNA or RNA helicase